MIAAWHEDPADLLRWLFSAALVILAHGGIAAAMVTRHQAVEPSEHSGAVLVEFAPLPAAPPAPATELAPGPEQVMSDAVPELTSATIESRAEDKISSKPTDQPPPDVPQAANPELAIELRTPEPKLQTPRQQDPRASSPATSAPQAIPERMAAIAAAPSQSQLTHGDSKALAKWTTQIMELLNRNKRYPRAAHARGEHGVRPRVLQSRSARTGNGQPYRSLVRSCRAR
jgi:periplasmic protein TonB